VAASGKGGTEGSGRPIFRAAFLLLLFLWPAKKRRIKLAIHINLEPAYNNEVQY